MILTLDEAQRLHDATLEAIDAALTSMPVWQRQLIQPHVTADRASVATNLAGLRYCYVWFGPPGPCSCDLDDADPHWHHSALFDWFAENLSRTAALYGVTDA